MLLIQAQDMSGAVLDHLGELSSLVQRHMGVALLVGIFLWRFGNTLRIYTRRPVRMTHEQSGSPVTDDIKRNLQISGRTLIFGKWLSTLQFITNAPQLIERAYAKVLGCCFAKALSSNRTIRLAAHHLLYRP